MLNFWDPKWKVIPEVGGKAITQSPGERDFTAAPIAWTSPTPSYPPTAGGGGLTGYTPMIIIF